MTTSGIKHIISAIAALAVLTMVLSSVFSDVNSSVVRTKPSGQGFAAVVSSLGL